MKIIIQVSMLKYTELTTIIDYLTLTLFASGGEVEGFRLKPHALGGGAGVSPGDWSVFIQVGSLKLLQNSSWMSNKFSVVNFWIVSQSRKRLAKTF